MSANRHWVDNIYNQTTGSPPGEGAGGRVWRSGVAPLGQEIQAEAWAGDKRKEWGCASFAEAKRYVHQWLERHAP